MIQPQIIMSLGNDDAAIAIAVDPLNGEKVLLIGTKSQVRKMCGAVLRSSAEARSMAAALEASAPALKK